MQEAQRALVRPLGIVDEQHQRPPLGEIRARPVQAVQRRVIILGGGERRLGARQQRSYQRRCAAQHLTALARREQRQRRLEQLPRYPEREVTLELVATAGEHRHRGRGRSLPRGTEQRRLADAGGTLEHREPAMPTASVRAQPFDEGELFLTLTQDNDDGGKSRVLPVAGGHRDAGR